MKLNYRPVLLPAILLVLLLSQPPIHPAEAEPKPPLLLKKGGRVVMMGDSITEGRNYSKLVELYFTICLPELDLHVLNLGWSGASLQKLRGRLRLLTLPFKPDIVTLCAGGVDGYAVFTPAVGENYTNQLNFIVDTLKSAGATSIVCSPCAMDPHFAKGKVYPESLAQIRELARKTAETQQMPFADVNGVMTATMVKTKAAFGDDYPVCGRDGVHPCAAGGLVIAYELLKTLGVDGHIGTITLDMKGGATATDGHKVLSSENGKAEIESARYPFCFTGDEKSPDGTRSILPFIPFNQDLNRFMLVVKNLDSEKAKVTWGTESKVFTKKELESGVNLAEAFVAGNPFSENFKKVDAAVYAKQGLDSDCKRVLEDVLELTDHSNPWFEDASAVALLDEFRKRIDVAREKSRAEVRATASPVKHTLSITPEQ